MTTPIFAPDRVFAPPEVREEAPWPVRADEVLRSGRPVFLSTGGEIAGAVHDPSDEFVGYAMMTSTPHTRSTPGEPPREVVVAGYVYLDIAELPGAGSAALGDPVMVHVDPADPDREEIYTIAGAGVQVGTFGGISRDPAGSIERVLIRFGGEISGGGSGGGGVAELPPTDELDAVEKGVPTVWTGTFGAVLPAGKFVGQKIMALAAGTYLQPDGTTPIQAGAGDVFAWAGSVWFLIDLVIQQDLDTYAITFLQKGQNLADVQHVPTARSNIDVYSKAEVDALIAAGGSGGGMGGVIGKLFGYPASFRDPFEERSQHTQYWATDTTGTGGSVYPNANPGTAQGGVGWIRLVSVAASAILMLPTDTATQWPSRGNGTLVNGRNKNPWVVVAWRFNLKNAATLCVMGFGNPFPVGSLPATYAAIRYSTASGQWDLAIVEGSESEISAPFITTPPPPENTEAYWCAVSCDGDGRYRGVIRDRDGTEHLTNPVTVPWWPGATEQRLAPFCAVGFGGELFLDDCAMWDGQTVSAPNPL